MSAAPNLPQVPQRKAPSGWKATLVQRQLWKAYEDVSPKAGMEFDEWVVAAGDEFDVPEEWIRNVISKQARQFTYQAKKAVQSEAQRVADMVGASLEAALRTQAEALTATYRKLLLDGKGNPIKKEDGTYECWETPDWDARLDAARDIQKVYGAHAPTEYKVTQEQHVHLHNATVEELMKRSNELSIDIMRLTGKGDSAGENQRGADLPASPRGRFLLADPTNKDPG